jgi:REP element-mobilizing transposase RayT
LIEAIVVLPDHLHGLWRLPPGDHDFPTRWRLITRFSCQIPARERISDSRARSAAYGSGVTGSMWSETNGTTDGTWMTSTTTP